MEFKENEVLNLTFIEDNVDYILNSINKRGYIGTGKEQYNIASYINFLENSKDEQVKEVKERLKKILYSLSNF